MIAFVVNLKAAGGRLRKVWPRVQAEASSRLGKSFCAVYTAGPMHAMELTRNQLRQGAEIIVSVGGDGTLNEVVNGFFEKGQAINERAALAVLSFGTGADFIRSSGWPRNYIEALDRLTQAKRRRIDLGKGEFLDREGRQTVRYFINIAEFGCGGAVVDRVNRLSKRWGGKISFMWGIAATLLSYDNQKIGFSLDGGTWRTEILHNTVVANGRYFGSGLKPAPNAELDDGLLDAVIFKNFSRLELFKSFPKLKKGEHLSHPKVESGSIRKISATSEETVLLDMDGEMVGQLPVTIEIVPHVLDVCV